MTIVVLLLFAGFGAICGLYVSVVGFVITTFTIFVGLGLVSAVTGGSMTPRFLVIAFVTEQVGFFLTIVALALREVLRRGQGAQKPINTSVSVEREQTR